MPIVRVIADLRVAAQPGNLIYEDGNYPDRAGWKEIAIGKGPDRSKELTAYPQDPLLAPPQDLKASVKWTAPAPVAPAPAAIETPAPSMPAEIAAPAASRHRDRLPPGW